MTYYAAYNPAIGNALVGVRLTPFDNLPDGVMMEAIEGDMPDLSKRVWSEGSLRFEIDQTKVSRWLTETEFMRRFTQEERLGIRELEGAGDLVLIDAMELMRGTEEGVNLDDPDVLRVLQYLAYVVNKIAPERIEEILS